MKISIKSNDEIKKMRIAGKLAAEVLDMITPFVQPGISTGELDAICFKYILNMFRNHLDCMKIVNQLVVGFLRL